MSTVQRDSAEAGSARKEVGAGLDFLWLELTNRCNLQCVHCYTESGPHTGELDLLTTDDYLSVMRQAYALGCRRMQFIGGEPQLNRDFHRLLVASKDVGFDFVEVFSNLTRLEERTLRFAREAGIRFATSVYSEDPEVHQAITRNSSSHARTIKNLKRLIDNGVVTRAAVIAIDQSPADIERTKRFLTELGVGSVRASEVREFGRGEEILSREAQMSGLCGHCWAGRLCVAPDGNAYPCVMARQWPVGNILEAPLADIVYGDDLADVRRQVHDTVWLPKLAAGQRPRAHDGGDEGGYPSEGEPTPADCPQSCEPCPQSCEPEVVVVCEPDGECPQSPGCPQSPAPGCPQSPSDEPCPQSCEPEPVVVCEPDAECPQSPGPGCPQSPGPGCPQSSE